MFKEVHMSLDDLECPKVIWSTSWKPTGV